MGNQPKIEPKSTKNRPNINQKSTQNRAKFDQNRKLSRTSSWEPSWSRLGCVLEASWAPLRVQDTSKLASQIEGKSIKNPCKNRSKIRCLPSSSFYAILIDFWSENEGMLAPKSDQKSMPTSKGDFLKKRGFTLAKTIILEVLGPEVESKNRSTINQNSTKN